MAENTNTTTNFSSPVITSNSNWPLGRKKIDKMSAEWEAAQEVNPNFHVPQSEDESRDVSEPPTAAAGILMYRAPLTFQFLGTGVVEYLLLQSSDGHFHWGPPRGHVDPGEDKLTTVIRSTEEETGLFRDLYEFDVSFPPIVLTYEVDHKLETVEYFLAKLKEPETPITLSEKCQDFGWVNVDAALSMTYANIGEAIRKVDKYIREKAMGQCN